MTQDDKLFETGDIVQLVSGGPLMTFLDRSDLSEAERESVHNVVWFDRADLCHAATIPHAMLVHVDVASEPTEMGENPPDTPVGQEHNDPEPTKEDRRTAAQGDAWRERMGFK
jgi:uncharacterized protein YodC (DUF2158 family)